MKKGLVFCLVIGLGLGVFYLVPKTVDKSLQGIEYQLGPGHKETIPVTIKLQGRVYHSLLGKMTFVGKIDLVGGTYPNPYKGHQATVHFDKYGTGLVGYGPYKENGHIVSGVIGNLFVSRDFNKVTFAEFRAYKNGGKGWGPGNQWLATGPANSRSKALEISNELMKNAIVGKLR